MIITAMLAWFNEDPAILHRAVSSLSVIADRVIAVDGGWDLYPGAQPTSPPEQADAILDGARAAGIQAVIYPGRHWTGQVAKRNHMLQLAAQDSDWVMPLDADWELQGDRDQIRAELEHTTADSIVVPLHTPHNPDARLRDTAATDWHRDLAGRTVHEALIYRVLKDMRVENFHWCYSGERNGQRFALWGQQPKHVPAAKHDLKAPFQIMHWCLHRDQRTIQANRDYCNRRAKHVTATGREP